MLLGELSDEIGLLCDCLILLGRGLLLCDLFLEVFEGGREGVDHALRVRLELRFGLGLEDLVDVFYLCFFGTRSRYR